MTFEHGSLHTIKLVWLGTLEGHTRASLARFLLGSYNYFTYIEQKWTIRVRLFVTNQKSKQKSKGGRFYMKQSSDGWLPPGKFVQIILDKFADQTIGLRWLISGPKII